MNEKTTFRTVAAVDAEFFNGEIIEQTCQFRWFVPNGFTGQHGVLQQAWANQLGEIVEWRDVETHVEGEG